MQNTLFESSSKRNYPFQNEAIRSTLNEFERGTTSTALVMATGTGKTYVFSQIAKEFIRRFGKPVLILAHRIELIEQAVETLRSFDLTPAIEQGNRRTLADERFNVLAATVPSLRERLANYPKDYFSLIITDECHHAVCQANQEIYDHFSSAKHLGVTATPLRSDSVGLKNVFQTVAFQYSIQQGIEEKYLCEIKGKRIKVEGLKLEDIKLSKADFSRAELDEMLADEKVLLKMVLPTLEHAENRPTIVFTQNVKHAHGIADCFNRQAGKSVAVAVDGSTNDAIRRTRINSFKTGEIQFIVNVGVLTEGFDYPPTACIALFRPTRSITLLAQMIGRGTRIWEGKKDCLILDFVGANNSVRVCNVLDVLDGTVLSDAEHARAQKYLDTGDDAKTALERAKIDVAKLEALQIKWKALSSSDAFNVMKLFAVPSAKGLWGGKLATLPQRGLLELKGLKVPATMEKGEADRLIKEIIRRDTLGLATLKQLRYLKRLGYKDFDIENLTRTDAGRMISAAQNSKQKAYSAWR